MALRGNKNKGDVGETKKPEVNEADEVVKETAQDDTPQESAPVEDKQVAVKKEVGAIEASGPAAPTLMALRNQLDPTDFGTGLRRLKAGSGTVTTTEREDLGKYADIQVLSTSERWMITPIADKDDTDAAKFCRASYDGGNTIPDIEGGDPESVDDYTSRITAEEGYEFNNPKKYLDIFGIILGCDNKKVESEATQWDMVQISISPTGIQAFRIFEMGQKLNVARGLLSPDRLNCMRVEAVNKQGKTRDYTVLQPKLIPADLAASYNVVGF